MSTFNKPYIDTHRNRLMNLMDKEYIFKVPKQDMSHLFAKCPELIQYVEHKPEIVKCAVQSSDKAISYVEQNDHNCMLAIDYTYMALKNIKNPSDNVIMYAIDKAAYAIMYVEDSRKLSETVIDHYIRTLIDHKYFSHSAFTQYLNPLNKTPVSYRNMCLYLLHRLKSLGTYRAIEQIKQFCDENVHQSNKYLTVFLQNVNKLL